MSWLRQIADAWVLAPAVAGVLPLLLYGMMGEIITFLPAITVLSAELVFLKGSVTGVFAFKFLLFVALPVAVGVTLGSYPYYWLAHRFGRPVIDKLGKYVRVSHKDVERIEKKFQGRWYDEALFLFLRSIPLIPTLPVHIAAGILEMRRSTYIALTLLGNILKVMLLLLLTTFVTITP